mmetsp:Transcript_3198/g.9102  ORF Transcript_3198/g.9102 Transcript_3198/m.9102 type:complete len:285 (-) Transcript_3198:57-911(-)
MTSTPTADASPSISFSFSFPFFPLHFPIPSMHSSLFLSSSPSSSTFLCAPALPSDTVSTVAVGTACASTSPPPLLDRCASTSHMGSEVCRCSHRSPRCPICPSTMQATRPGRTTEPGAGPRAFRASSSTLTASSLSTYGCSCLICRALTGATLRRAPGRQSSWRSHQGTRPSLMPPNPRGPAATCTQTSASWPRCAAALSWRRSLSQAGGGSSRWTTRPYLRRLQSSTSPHVTSSRTSTEPATRPWQAQPGSRPAGAASSSAPSSLPPPPPIFSPPRWEGMPSL